MISNKKKIKVNRRRIGNRRRKNPRINTTKYMYSRALQTMGVGTAKVRVTRFYSYLPNTIGTNQNFVSELVRDSVASQEFNRFAQDFSYTRLKKITVTCVPSAANSASPVFFKFDWIDSESQDVTFDDNAKLVWQTTMKPITYKFRPPNILLNNLNEEKPIKINFREWQDSKTLVAENIPGYLKVTTPVTTKLIGEVIWIFRGYNAKFPYARKEIINDKGKEIKEEDEIDGIIRDLKVLALKKDEIDEEEEKRIKKKERKERKMKEIIEQRERKKKGEKDKEIERQEDEKEVKRSEKDKLVKKQEEKKENKIRIEEFDKNEIESD